MTARGAKAEGQNVYLFKNSDDSFEYVPATGGNGGNEVQWSNGLSGANGYKPRSTGGRRFWR